MSPKTAYDYLMKFIIIGDSGVGKTCFLMRFADDSFTTSHISTIGIDFKIKPITIDGKSIKLQIWDTAGQDRFRTITQTYYKGAMGVILAYDCTDENSFNNVRNWIKQLEAHATPGVCKVLVGNKSDSPNKKVDASRGEALAKEYGMKFFDASAKNNLNVKETFYYLAKEVKDKTTPNAVQNANNGVKLDTTSATKDGGIKGNCC
jgi:Ras-related protein Rab-8A